MNFIKIFHNMPKLIIILLCFFFSVSANAKNIEISGNKRIETETIKIYFKKNNFDNEGINKSLKSLYKTNFFSDIKVSITKDEIKVSVIENPIVNKIEIVGNKKLDKDVFIQEMSLGERSVYTKLKLITDIARINEIYKRSGRIHAVIIPKVKFLDNNRLDIIIKIDENKKTKVKQVILHGNKSFSSKSLKKVISTKEQKWYRSSSSFFDPDRISFDKQLLRRFYLNHGYAKFNVSDIKIEYFSEINRFISNYFLNEGKIFNFSGVEFESQYHNINLSDLKEQVVFQKNEKFSLDKIESSVDKILTYLNDRGFAFADVEYDLKTNDEDQTVLVKILIKKNRRIYIRNIKIIGNTRTEDKVIRREIRLLEGDAYNNTKLKRSKQRLVNLGFFGNITIKKIPVPREDLIDITFEVEEKPTGELNFGFGYSTTEKFLGNVVIKERNLSGKAHSIALSAQKSSRSDDIDFSYTIPNFLDREFSFGFDVFNLNTEYTESSSQIKTNGFSTKIFYELTEYITQSINYSFKVNEVSILNASNASIYIREQEGETSYSAISQGLYYDKRNNRINPSKGFYTKLSTTIAGFGGDTKFFKSELGAVKYYPLWKNKLIFKSLIKGGTVDSFDNNTVKINHRFFLGGVSLRGFQNAGVGPRDNTGAALGGKYFYKGTLELLFPIGLPEELGFKGSIFSDFGTLTGLDDKTVDILDSGSIRASIGFGISWDSPLGPIRFDFARAIEREAYDRTENFRINFGVRF